MERCLYFRVEFAEVFGRNFLFSVLPLQQDSVSLIRCVESREIGQLHGSAMHTGPVEVWKLGEVNEHFQ